MSSLVSPELLTAIRALLTQTRIQLQQTINHTMVKTYWEVGHLIVEHEQRGAVRAGYGQQLLQGLAQELRAEFGKGFTARNLANMRAFYVQNPIWHSVSAKLSWTHHRVLLRVQNPKARDKDKGFFECHTEPKDPIRYSLSKDEKFIAIPRNSFVDIIDLERKVCIKTISCSATVKDVKFTPDNKALLVLEPQSLKRYQFEPLELEQYFTPEHSRSTFNF